MDKAVPVDTTTTTTTTTCECAFPTLLSAQLLGNCFWLSAPCLHMADPIPR
jgi:hypothetical protein